LYFQAAKKSGLPLVAVFVVFTFFDQGLIKIMEADLRSPTGATSMIFFYAALYLANSIFFMTLAIVIGLYGCTNSSVSLPAFVGRFLNQSCIEVVRAWGKILSWSFLLIIPGFIKYLHYLFVPLVVLLFPQYDKGEADALKTSRELFKKHGLLLVFTVLAFQVLWSYFSVSLFDAYRSFWHTPIPSLAISVLDTAVFLLYTLVLFRIYQRSVREVFNESIV
jgi:hypothetical protein